VVGAAGARGRALQPRNQRRVIIRTVKPSKKQKQQDVSTQHSNSYRAVGQQFDEATGKAASQSQDVSSYGFNDTQGNVSLAGQIQDHFTDEVAMYL
jgi:hypothetical protein